MVEAPRMQTALLKLKRLSAHPALALGLLIVLGTMVDAGQGLAETDERYVPTADAAALKAEVRFDRCVPHGDSASRSGALNRERIEREASSPEFFDFYVVLHSGHEHSFRRALWSSINKNVEISDDRFVRGQVVVMLRGRAGDVPLVRVVTELAGGPIKKFHYSPACSPDFPVWLFPEEYPTVKLTPAPDGSVEDLHQATRSDDFDPVLEPPGKRPGAALSDDTERTTYGKLAAEYLSIGPPSIALRLDLDFPVVLTFELEESIPVQLGGRQYLIEELKLEYDPNQVVREEQTTEAENLDTGTPATEITDQTSEQTAEGHEDAVTHQGESEVETEVSLPGPDLGKLMILALPDAFDALETDGIFEVSDPSCAIEERLRDGSFAFVCEKDPPYQFKLHGFRAFDVPRRAADLQADQLTWEGRAKINVAIRMLNPKVTDPQDSILVPRAHPVSWSDPPSLASILDGKLRLPIAAALPAASDGLESECGVQLRPRSLPDLLADGIEGTSPCILHRLPRPSGRYHGLRHCLNSPVADSELCLIGSDSINPEAWTAAPSPGIESGWMDVYRLERHMDNWLITERAAAPFSGLSLKVDQSIHQLAYILDKRFPNASIQLYSRSMGCHGGVPSNSVDYRVGLKAELGNGQQPAYPVAARLQDQGEFVSRCVLGLRLADGVLGLGLTPYGDVPRRRAAIVIAPGLNFRSGGNDVMIREAINRLPLGGEATQALQLRLFEVRPQGSVDQLWDSDAFAIEAMEIGLADLSTTLRDLEFVGTQRRPLIDLVGLDRWQKRNPFERIVYVTADSANESFVRETTFFLSRWRVEGLNHISVVTNSDCDLWTAAGVVDDCLQMTPTGSDREARQIASERVLPFLIEALGIEHP